MVLPLEIKNAFAQLEMQENYNAHVINQKADAKILGLHLMRPYDLNDQIQCIHSSVMLLLNYLNKVKLIQDALQKALNKQEIEAIRSLNDLVKRGFPVDLQEPEHGYAAAHIGVFLGSIELLKSLHHFNANFNIRSNSGKSLLAYANNISIVQLLHTFNIDIFEQDKKGVYILEKLLNEKKIKKPELLILLDAIGNTAKLIYFLDAKTIKELDENLLNCITKKLFDELNTTRFLKDIYLKKVAYYLSLCFFQSNKYIPLNYFSPKAREIIHMDFTSELVGELDKGKRADLHWIKSLLETGLPVNTQGAETKFTAVHYAVARNDIDMLKWLVYDLGAQLNIPSCNGETPIFYTIPINKEVLKVLIAAGANPLHKNNKDQFAFKFTERTLNYLLALELQRYQFARFEIIENLIMEGASPSVSSLEEPFYTVLHAAARISKVVTTQFIESLHEKIDFNKGTVNPLFYSCDYEKAIALIKGGASLESHNLGKSAFSWLCGMPNFPQAFYPVALKMVLGNNGYIPMIQELISNRGVNPHLHVGGWNIAHSAAAVDALWFMDYLIKLNIDLNQSTNSLGQTPLSLAKSVQMIEKLIQCGANLLLKNKAGYYVFEQLIEVGVVSASDLLSILNNLAGFDVERNFIQNWEKTKQTSAQITEILSEPNDNAVVETLNTDEPSPLVPEGALQSVNAELYNTYDFINTTPCSEEGRERIYSNQITSMYTFFFDSSPNEIGDYLLNTP